MEVNFPCEMEVNFPCEYHLFYSNEIALFLVGLCLQIPVIFAQFMSEINLEEQNRKLSHNFTMTFMLRVYQILKVYFLFLLPDQTV